MSKKSKGENYQMPSVFESEDDSDGSIDPLRTARRVSHLENEIQLSTETLHRSALPKEKESVNAIDSFLQALEKSPMNAAETSSTTVLCTRLATLEHLAGTGPKGFFSGIANVLRWNRKTFDEEKRMPPQRPLTVVIHSTRLYNPAADATQKDINTGGFMLSANSADNPDTGCEVTRGKCYDKWRTILAEMHTDILLQAVRTAQKLDAAIEPQAIIVQNANRDLQETIQLSNTLSDAISCFLSIAPQCYPAVKR